METKEIKKEIDRVRGEITGCLNSGITPLEEQLKDWELTLRIARKLN